MPRTKEQYESIRLEKRKLIRDTALHLFANEGYAQTSINRIAAAAGISKGLMYNYFESKEALLQNIMDTLADEFDVMIDPDRDGQITLNELEGFIDKLFEMLVNRKEEFKLYYQMSFQPQVLDFFIHRYNSTQLAAGQQLIVSAFSKLLKMSDKAAYFTVVTLLKGLPMVACFADSVYDREFLMRYKEELKQLIIKTY